MVLSQCCQPGHLPRGHGTPATLQAGPEVGEGKGEQLGRMCVQWTEPCGELWVWKMLIGENREGGGGPLQDCVSLLFDLSWSDSSVLCRRSNLKKRGVGLAWGTSKPAGEECAHG